MSLNLNNRKAITRFILGFLKDIEGIGSKKIESLNKLMQLRYLNNLKTKKNHNLAKVIKLYRLIL